MIIPIPNLCLNTSRHVISASPLLWSKMEWLIDIYLACAILEKQSSFRKVADFAKKRLKQCINRKLNITSGFCGKCATRFAARNGHASLFAEQGNQVRVLNMFCSRNRGESCGNVQFNSCDCGVYPFSAKAGHWRS